jgi:hypothetical protein
MEITEINKYNTGDIAKWIRETIKKEHPDLKISVRTECYSGGSLINVIFRKSKKIRFFRTIDEIDESEIRKLATARNREMEETREYIETILKSQNYNINDKWIDSNWGLTSLGKEKIKKVLKIINKYNWDNSDSMVDYFDVNYYTHIKIGEYNRPFIDGKELLKKYEKEEIQNVFEEIKKGWEQ